MRLFRIPMSSARRLAIISLIVALLFALLRIASSSPVQALSSDVVISEVYGGGGNSGATIKNDYIELRNLTGNPISVNGWSVQYASAAGAVFQMTNISGTIPAHGYYLIQQAAGAAGTLSLPTPDATGSVPMSATSGVVALVTVQIPLVGCGISCATAPNVKDLVGYGATANVETLAAPGLTNTTAAARTGAMTDTDNNSVDFSAGVPEATNSAGVTVRADDLLPTDTPTPTATNTPTDTPTPTDTSTPTNTPTDTPTPTATNTPTNTPIPNSPPTATVTNGQCSATNMASGTINLALNDVDGDSLTLTFVSNSNTTLVPNNKIVLGGSGNNRTLTVTATSKKSGSATLTFNLSDGKVTVPVVVTVIVGTDKNDTLNGTSGIDMSFGLNGTDTINGNAGNDLLCGGNGDGTINGGDGNDILDGQKGNDVLNGGNGNDILRGNLGNDGLTGGSDADSFSGGMGQDIATDFNAVQGDTQDGTIP